MKYLFEVKVKNIIPTCNRFIVSWFDDFGSVKYSFMDLLGQIYDDKSYLSLSERADGFFEARTKFDIRNKILIDNNCCEIFTCSANAKIGEFSNGFAVYQEKDKRAYFLNNKGQILGDKFKNVIGFSNGLGVVQQFNDKYVAVNDKMDVVSQEFDYLNPFDNANYSWAVVDKKVVIIDRNFNIVSREYIDENGNVVPYRYISSIDENNIILNHNFRSESDEIAKCSMISIDGKKLGKSHNLINKSCEGIYRVYDKEGTSFVDKNGKYIVERHFINCSDFNEGIAVVGKTNEFGEFVYAFLKKDGKFLTINFSYLNGKPELSKIWVPYVQDFNEGFGAVILTGENSHLINSDGYVLRNAYHKLGLFHDDFAKFKTKTKKYSYINKNTLKPVGIEFDAATPFKNGYATVRVGDDIDVIDKNFIMLSEVSYFAYDILKDTNNICEIPNNYFYNEKLILSLFDLAERVADLKHDYSIMSKIENEKSKAKEKIIKFKQIKNDAKVKE